MDGALAMRALANGGLGALGVAAPLFVDVPEWIAGPQLLALRRSLALAE